MQWFCKSTQSRELQTPAEKYATILFIALTVTRHAAASPHRST